MLNMPITDGMSYEGKLLAAAQTSLKDQGQLALHQRMQHDRALEIDLLYLPKEGAYADVPHVVEVKYSRSRTLPSFVLLQTLQMFKLIYEANDNLNIRFALVTNARFEANLIGSSTPSYVQVIDQIGNADAFVAAIRRWSSECG
jgi:hypothetical protein